MAGPAQEEESESDDQMECMNAPEDPPRALAHSAAQSDPLTFKSAMKRPDGAKWMTACLEEMGNHMSNRTWDLVPLPPGAKALDAKWVLTVKHNADGSIERYKARMVAKGFSQRPGFEYSLDATFSPTYRPATLRLIASLAAIHGLKLHSIDISHAFILGDLQEEVYMCQPEGFHEGGPNIVCKLNKSLYGLKQSAHNWNKKLHGVLSSMGFTRLESDRSVYIFIRGDVRIIVPVFVDDITFASKSQEAIDSTIQELSTHFKLRNLGPTSFLLGIAITQDHKNGIVSLCQRQYILDVLERFGMSDCKPITTPLDPGLTLSTAFSPQTAQERQEMVSIPYLSAVGSLMYLATSTRPDIAYSVGLLARFSSNPGMRHWAAVKHLMRYIKGTLDLKLVYRRDAYQDGGNLFVTYSDADHGGCKDSGKSTGGYLTCVAGGAVGWSSKLQGIVTLSSTEAEYIAAVEAGKEALWMRNILREFGYPTHSAVTLFIDNQSAISVAKNPEHHGRMKHLDIRWYWLRDNVESGLLKPVHLSTNDNVADILTKGLPRAKVELFRAGLGLKP